MSEKKSPETPIKKKKVTQKKIDFGINDDVVLKRKLVYLKEDLNWNVKNYYDHIALHQKINLSKKKTQKEKKLEGQELRSRIGWFEFRIKKIEKDIQNIEKKIKK